MEWKPIPDWPEYEISARGAIRRADTGYRLTVRGRYATLSRGGVLCRVAVAQARAEAFAREPEAEPAAPAAPTATPEAEEWAPLVWLEGYEINRHGDVRRMGQTQCLKPTRGWAGQSYVQVRTPLGPRAGCINVLLEETFGPGAAQAAGYPIPDMARAATRRAATALRESSPRRRCHDCGKPTTNYRCQACWIRLRGDSSDTYDPMCE
jgi:hypothetical protein